MSAGDVVTALAAARRAIQLYPPTHPAYREAMDSCVRTMLAETAVGPFVLNWHQGRLYHESSVIPDDVQGAKSIAEAFESRAIESLTFAPDFGETDAVALAQVLSLRPNPDLDVALELSERQATAIAVAVIEKEDDEERQERDRLRQADRTMYHRAAVALRKVRDSLTAGGANIGDTSGFVTHIMERLFADPAAVMGLATLRSSKESDLFHSLNVMIYTLVLGHRLGLPEEGLSSLGLSALLHDIGKTAFVASDSQQAVPMRVMHPQVGAEILKRAAMDDPAPMLVAYEHHMQPDGGGWPERDESYVAHPYSRMVAIANRYDNLTSTSESRDPLTPDKAVVRILQEGGSLVDPFFARLFANAIGVFPVGCLVRLSDHSVGVVVRPGEDPLAPVVRLAYDDRGSELTDGLEIDLADGNVRILEVIAPDALNVDVSEKL